MDRSTVHAAACAAIREEACETLPDLKPEDTFDSLGLGSLDLLCVCQTLELKLGIRVEQKQLREPLRADGTKQPVNEMTVSQFVDQVMEMSNAGDRDPP